MKKVFLILLLLSIQKNNLFSQTNLSSSTSDFVSIRNSNLLDNATNGSVNLNFFTTTSSNVGTKISTFKETFNTAGLAFYTQFGFTAPIERMRISATGNVGIGTSNTISVLNLRNIQLSNDAASGSVDLAFHTTSNGEGTKISTFKETFNTAGLAFYTQFGYSAPFERMRISAIGNVAIGSTITNSTLSLRNTQLTNDANSGNIDLSFYTTDNGFGTKISTFKETSNTAGLAFHTQYGYTAPIEKMRISAIGNVAIGSTITNSTLSLRNTLLANDANSGNIDLSFYTTDNGIGTKISTFKETSNTAGLAFHTQNGYSSPVERMRITAIGKVAIGDVSTPGNYLLYVEKGILTEEVKVALKSSTAWADYVFNKDYKLKSLQEVEEFIQENKHLPNVPSAVELMNDGGVNVSSMMSKQMEKIEELTLYIIEQNKKLEKLQAQVNKLQNK